MAEDDPNSLKFQVNMLEVNMEKLVYNFEVFNLQLLDLRWRMESLEVWRRQTQEGSDSEALHHATSEAANKVEETFEDSARKKDDSVNGTTEFKFRVIENAGKVEAEEPVQHLLTGTESLAEESKAELQDNSLQQIEKESRSPKGFIQDAGKSEHPPMKEGENIEEVNPEEKECTQIKVLVESVELVQPKEAQVEFVEKSSEGAKQHEDCIPAGEVLVAEDMEFEPQENGQKKVRRAHEAVSGTGGRKRKTIHFEGDDQLKCDLPEEAMGSMEGEEFDFDHDSAGIEDFSEYMKLNTSDELERRFCEDARKQEELIQNNINEALRLITTNIEKEINVKLPMDLRKYLDERVRKLVESTQVLLKLRVHELESELRIQTHSIYGHKTEIMRLHNQLPRKFWNEYPFKERLNEAQEALNKELLLRKKYEDMSLDFARVYDEVTVNIEKQMKLHTRLCLDYKKLKTDYEELKVKYERTYKLENKCEANTDQVVVETEPDEGNTEDELPPTLLNVEVSMLFESLNELKETVLNPSAAPRKERELKVETIERPGALDYGRRKLAAYVNMEPDLRCEKLEKVLEAHKKRHDYFWKGLIKDLKLSVFEAVGNGCPLLTGLFLEYGETCNVADRNQNTLLHYAARDGNTSVGRALIKAGSIVNSRNVVKMTPLHVALSYAHINFSLLLVRSGTNVHLRDDYMNTPLHLATLTQNFVLMKMLIENNVEVNAIDVNGDTPFLNSAITGDAELGLMLLEAGADITATNLVGSTAMHLAAWQGNYMFCCFIVSQLVPVDTINIHNVTPLHLAAMEGHNLIVELLIKSGARVNAVEDKTDSPLHYAAKLGNAPMAEVLILAGADVLARNFFDWTPLHFAAYKGHGVLCSMLLVAGSIVNAIDSKKRTPLHLAVLSDDYVSVVQLLVEQGANMKATDNDQKTPCDLGYELGNFEVAMWLEEQMFVSDVQNGVEPRGTRNRTCRGRS